MPVKAHSKSDGKKRKVSEIGDEGSANDNGPVYDQEDDRSATFGRDDPEIQDSDLREDLEEDLSGRRTSAPVKVTSKLNGKKRTASEIGGEDREEEEEAHSEESIVADKDDSGLEHWAVSKQTSTGYTLSWKVSDDFAAFVQETVFPALGDLMETRLEKENSRRAPKDLDQDWLIHAKKTTGCITQFLKEARTVYARDDKHYTTCRNCFRNGSPCLRYDGVFYFCLLPEKLRGLAGERSAFIYGEKLMDRKMEKIHGAMWEEP